MVTDAVLLRVLRILQADCVFVVVSYGVKNRIKSNKYEERRTKLLDKFHLLFLLKKRV